METIGRSASGGLYAPFHLCKLSWVRYLHVNELGSLETIIKKLRAIENNRISIFICKKIIYIQNHIHDIQVHLIVEYSLQHDIVVRQV